MYTRILTTIYLSCPSIVRPIYCVSVDRITPLVSSHYSALVNHHVFHYSAGFFFEKRVRKHLSYFLAEKFIYQKILQIKSYALRSEHFNGHLSCTHIRREQKKKRIHTIVESFAQNLKY